MRARMLFENAVADLTAFYAAWPDAVKNLITGRFPLDRFAEPIHNQTRHQEYRRGRRLNETQRDRSGARPAGRRRPPRKELEALGALSFGTPMGHGSRGLLGHRRMLELFSARPCAQPGLSMGRRRTARNLRPRRPLVLCPGAVERPGSDPEGAPFRPHRRAGKSRRRRQRVLLLRRFFADSLLHEGACTSIRSERFPTSN